MQYFLTGRNFRIVTQFLYFLLYCFQSIIENARSDSEKILFVITDGYSNAGSPIPMAKKLKRQGRYRMNKC